MDKHLKNADFLSKVLDEQFSFLGYKFGLDPLIGLVPVLGDIIPACISIYMIWIGIQLKMPTHKVVRMIGNIIIDILLGIVPVLGDAADFVVKSSKRNFKILNEHVHSNIIEGEIIQ
jgi:hypothetical protein